jgi:hypothetical protein
VRATTSNVKERAVQADSTDEFAPPRDVDVDRPSVARMYDYLLGGSANFAADRAAAGEVIAAIPDAVAMARANRAFLGRVVRYLVHQGIDQFLDLGSGVPTVGNVHEVAQRYNPQARVAYVDIELVAVKHARNLLAGNEHVTVTQADIRRPSEVLTAPGVAGLLDFTRPVAVLAVAVAHSLPDTDEPARMIATYRDACAPGSYLAISHISPATLSDAQVERTMAVYRDRANTPGAFRTPGEIRALLPGYQLVDPGLVLVDEWQPDKPVTRAEAARTNFYGALGWLPPA